MNTVDLSESKVGDVVHFRCGGSANIGYLDEWKGKKIVVFSGITRMAAPTYFMDGRYSAFSQPHPFDIVKIEIK